MLSDGSSIIIGVSLKREQFILPEVQADVLQKVERQEFSYSVWRCSY
jgi:hypothetical protein